MVRRKTDMAITTVEAKGFRMTAAERVAGEARFDQLIAERDALPEGSPERHAVALRIFDATFAGHVARETTITTDDNQAADPVALTTAEQAAGEAIIDQLFAERDALPEGSPERLAVARKIFDFTFGGGRRP
jgi:hypothetical protein